MSLKTAKTLLKVLGILSIIGAVIVFLFGVLTMAGGGLMAANPDAVAEAQAGVADADKIDAAKVFGAGIGLIITAVLELLQGIFSVRASKDSSKYKGAWIFALINLVAGVINIIVYFAGQSNDKLFSLIGTLALAVLTFIAANTVKKDALGQ